MLKDCIEIFARELEKTEKQFGNREKFILDSYIPADGDYIVVQRDGTLKSRSFKLDKKTRTLNGIISGSQLDDDIKFYDYHSRLRTTAMQERTAWRRSWPTRKNRSLIFWRAVRPEILCRSARLR